MIETCSSPSLTRFQRRAIEWHNLPADKTETDKQVLDWDTSKAFIAGAYVGWGVPLKSMSLFEILKLWWMSRGY